VVVAPAAAGVLAFFIFPSVCVAFIWEITEYFPLLECGVPLQPRG